MSNYKVGGKYYLPVTVSEYRTGCTYPVFCKYNYDDTDQDVLPVVDKSDILLTSKEVAQTFNDDRVDFWKRDSESAHAELEKANKRIAELKGALERATAEAADLEERIVKDAEDPIIEQLKADGEIKDKEIGLQREYIGMLRDHIQVLLDNLKVIKYGGK